MILNDRDSQTSGTFLQVYQEYRNTLINKYREDVRQRLGFADARCDMRSRCARAHAAQQLAWRFRGCKSCGHMRCCICDLSKAAIARVLDALTFAVAVAVAL